MFKGSNGEIVAAIIAIIAAFLASCIGAYINLKSEIAHLRAENKALKEKVNQVEIDCKTCIDELRKEIKSDFEEIKNLSRHDAERIEKKMDTQLNTIVNVLKAAK